MMKTEYTVNARMLARIVCASVLAFILTGCVGTPERNPVPLELTQ